MNERRFAVAVKADRSVIPTGKPLLVEVDLFAVSVDGKRTAAAPARQVVVLIWSDRPANIPIELRATTGNQGRATVAYSRGYAGSDTIEVYPADQPDARARTAVRWEQALGAAARVKHPVKVFCSYAHEDATYREQLFRHASAMLRQGEISAWYDGLIVPGQRWRSEIYRHLEESDIVLTLISSDFLASDFCVSVELRQAVKRSDARELLVVPCIVRPCDWRTMVGDLQALPRDGRPISLWSDQDEAYLDVIRGLGNAAKALREHRGTTPDTNLQVASTRGPALGVSGIVVDEQTGAPLSDVCVTIGPPIRCFTRTDLQGHYTIDLGELGALPNHDWDFYFIQDGYLTAYSGKITVSGPTVLDVRLRKR